MIHRLGKIAPTIVIISSITLIRQSLISMRISLKILVILRNFLQTINTPLTIIYSNSQSLISRYIYRKIIAKVLLPFLTRSRLVRNSTSYIRRAIFFFYYYLSLVRFYVYLRKDPKQEFQKLSITILYIFLNQALNLRRGKNRRRLPRIKRKSLLETFQKVFRLVFERVTLEKIGSQINR